MKLNQQTLIESIDSFAIELKLRSIAQAQITTIGENEVVC